ncbi:hypothetical protein NPIL_472581 [Nephila pilipes]|uniref:Uncharacterized protein n=1 Tax=Nephila pilipes TaxID=299642 RepID=A0A8X6Q1U9_NEPPI|nr:hypothetical protein NPIL_472581 [Nephila pilipes]
MLGKESDLHLQCRSEWLMTKTVFSACLVRDVCLANRMGVEPAIFPIVFISEARRSLNEFSQPWSCGLKGLISTGKKERNAPDGKS